jgi:hypothetical protein
VLGANHPKKAKFSIVVATTTSAAIGLVFTAVALAARKQMPRLFTGDDAVVKETAKLGYLLSATIFLNSIQPVLSGILNLGFDFTFLPPRNDETLTCSVIYCRCGDRCGVAVVGRIRQHRLLLPRSSAAWSCFRLQAEAQCDSKTKTRTSDFSSSFCSMIMFKGNGLIFPVTQGIWAGMIFGTVLQTIILFIILVRTRWQKEVKLASSSLQSTS